MPRPAESSPQLDVSFLDSSRGTHLDRRIFRWPYTVSRTFRLDRVPAGMLTLIVQSVSGAILAEDALHQRYHVGSGAMAHVTTAGAASVYRAADRMESRDEVDLAVEDDGYLEYLPEPRILFSGSRLCQSLRIRVANGATAVVSDAFTLHDPAGSDKRFQHFASETVIQGADGELLALDRIDIEGFPLRSGRYECFSAFGTMVVTAPNILGFIESLRRQIEAEVVGIEGLYLAVSALPNAAGATLRVAAHDGRRLRQGLTAGWAATRLVLFGTKPVSRRK